MRHLKNGVHGQSMVFQATISAQHLPIIGLITPLSLPRPLHASLTPNATEMVFAAIKDFSLAIKQFNLTDIFVPPTLVQDLDALASLSAGSSKPYTFPTTDATSSPLAPASHTEPRVVQPAVHNPSVQETRVVETPQVVQEPRVVFSSLAIVTPVHTAPLATCSMIMPQSTLHLHVPSLPHPSTSILIMVPRSSTVPPRMAPKARTGTLPKPLK